MLFLKCSKHMKTTTEIAAVSNQGILDAASTALRPSESLVLAYLGHVTRNLAITFNFAIFGYLLSKSFQESLSLASGRSWTVSELWIVPRFSQPKQDIAHCQHRLDGPWSTTDCHWPHIFHTCQCHFPKVYVWRKRGDARSKEWMGCLILLDVTVI